MSEIFHELRYAASDLPSSNADDHALWGAVFFAIRGRRRLGALLNSSFCHGWCCCEVLRWVELFRDSQILAALFHVSSQSIWGSREGNFMARVMLPYVLEISMFFSEDFGLYLNDE